jgi:plasmid stabilization system protein ParE
MIQLLWLPEAKLDLQRLYDFIAPHSEDAATRAIETLIEAAGTLQDFPQKGRVWEVIPEFRELFVRFGSRRYVIRYRAVENQVIIVRVWHGLEDR